MTSNNKQPFIWASLAIVASFLLFAFLTLNDYGMGWDEITRWQSGDRKLDHYRALISSDGDGETSRMSGDRYPGLFDLPLAAFHATFGGNRMLQGHAMSILFGALGLVATAWLANTVFGARTAFFSTLFLAIFPRFYGHAMINPKDIPFLATYTLGLAGVFWICRKLAEDGKVSLGRFALCGLFIGLAGSSRIPGLVLVAIGAASWTGTLFWSRRKATSASTSPAKQWGQLFLGTSIAGIVALLTVLLFFPRAQTQIFSSITNVAGTLHTVSGSMPLLYGGQLMDAKDAPFAYAIRFFIISTPLWILGLLIFGIVAQGKELTGSRTSINGRHLLIILFLMAAAFPWLYVTLARPAIHDGLRHVLFAVPPLMIIAGFGASRLFDVLATRFPKLRNAVITGFVLMVALQIGHLVRMHPYQYVSFNLLAGNKATIPNRFDAEYWCTSSKHLLEALSELVPANPTGSDPVKIRVSGALDSARSFVPEGFILTNDFAEADFYVSNTNFRIDTIVDGEEIFRIERGGIPIGVIKKLPAPHAEDTAR